ncbi:MAG TPA: hypothetical protein VFM04_07925 [Candidatus Methylomirabilis sp.]|nr:hypothetical protein [Candidatus Methylomirabilis sp.]
MKRLLAFALALTLFAAPAVALAEDYNRAEDGKAKYEDGQARYLDSLQQRAG